MLYTRFSYSISVFLTIFFSIFAQAQELQELSILEADESYGKEIIKLPVSWAPNMTLEGFEELRFSPGWKDVESPQFWTYVLSWDVKASKPLTQTELASNLRNYFDGLMKPNHWATEFPEPTVQLQLAVTMEDVDFTGAMTYFHGFHTGNVMTTFIKATQFFCKTKQRTIVLFRISPQPYEHGVWNELHNIKKKAGTCEL